MLYTRLSISLHSRARWCRLPASAGGASRARLPVPCPASGAWCIPAPDLAGRAWSLAPPTVSPLAGTPKWGIGVRALAPRVAVLTPWAILPGRVAAGGQAWAPGWARWVAVAWTTTLLQLGMSRCADHKTAAIDVVAFWGFALTGTITVATLQEM